MTFLPVKNKYIHVLIDRIKVHFASKKFFRTFHFLRRWKKATATNIIS